MLNSFIACAITASAAAAEVPTHAPATLDESVPEALISQDAVMHRALTRMLYQGMPAAHQAVIAQAGAIGPIDAALADGHSVALDHGHHAESKTIEQIEAEYGITFSQAHRTLIERFQAGAEQGYPVPAICLDPNTDPKLAGALLAMIDGITIDNPERHQAVDRWTATAADGGGIPQSQTITLSYSIVPDGTPGDGDTSDLIAFLDNIYAGNGGTAEWNLRIDQTFNRWGFLCGVTYVKENDDGATVNSSNAGVVGVRGDVRIIGIFIDGASNVLAYNYFPNRGDMFIDTGDNFYNTLTQGSRRLKNVVSHEHGHGMGLAHVEPVEQTKLMEPFVSTAYVGPRIDDRIGAQRNYGDSLEDNDTAGTAFNVGSIADGTSYARTDLSTDDNSDIDYYQFDVAEAGDVTVTLELAAAEYLMGPQGGTPVLTDYNSIHDLKFDILDAGLSILGSVDSTPIGSDEVGTVALPSSGTYFLRVQPDNARNDCQLYNLDIAFSAGTPCAIDLNGDGVVDNGDIGEFINLFLAQDLSVDFNGDGVLDNGDIAAFIDAFLAGCP